MEAGLSLRAEKTLEDLLPAIAAGAPPRQYDATTAVDLSSAQNEVLRPELVRLLQSTVEDKITSKVFALPASNGGDAQLREALASFFNNHFHPIHPVKSAHIAITAGATDAIENVIHAVCDDGDSVLVPGPSWHGFMPMLKSRSNVNIVIAQPPAYDNWDNYLAASLQAVYDFSADRSRIKAVLLCNPHNPLSRCYSKKSLLEVMEFCQEHGLHLIVDEIYALTDLNTAPAKASPFVSALSLTEPLVPEGAVKVDPSRVHVVWSASKLFGMSGFRVGCIISQQNPSLLTLMSLLTKYHVSVMVSTYVTTLLTWSQLPTLLKLNSDRLTTSCQLLTNSLAKWNIEFITPSHGVFVFAKLAKCAKSAADEEKFYDKLAKAGVRVGEGRLYKGVEGEYGWARICFSLPVDVLQTALGRIEGVLAEGA
ncbi:hypothetical protein HBI56_214050 [Parastagonospora nodorum]|uniref:Aminotransferase class I/classII large domain-containing protein n=1 Tax=Phaeosphaeria nodorum (strain SN15 / ATCC MYA-4574 / FGSC 10173) TaxID=321614 RepID=A0A7U2I4S3_PHANO|nr:hypothetical protein HBH56_229990 [Parastagonospora nodorum]QRC99372.1 hypothetical protein JI435_142990 [Parastagonospora nodorum SN15]KAH3924547.1 hypothetical protein HBH54_195200 [Parastagonospora nodorum]KAH3940101.1 hypothetical protein HBH53_222790 [Parastagonospora nodorum]KAH3958358.1 hypothetical protein HBH51_209720 [Parastagonospora nodorum]